MKKKIITYIALALSWSVVVGAVDAPSKRIEPVKIIFDTDMGNDVDDALALGLIHSLQRRGACELLAVTLTYPDPLAAGYIDAVNTFYGRGDIPIGINPKSPRVERNTFVNLAEARLPNGARVFPHDFDEAKAPLAVDLLRKVLAEAADGEVVMIQVGFSTNLGALLQSGPDRFSPLNGHELVKKKVKFLSIMAGAFQTTGDSNYKIEYNIKHDIPAAIRLAESWPTPIVWSGFEIGVSILFPASSVDHGFNWIERHPIKEAYQLYKPTPHERPTWDLTSVIYAVYPDSEYFSLSRPGQVSVLPDGYTKFEPRRDGKHRFLIVNEPQRHALRSFFAALVTEPVGR